MPTRNSSQGVDRPSNSPYQLDLSQTAKACRILLKHVADGRKRRAIEIPQKPNLLELNDGDVHNNISAPSTDETPIWMILTTKKHVVDKPRLKPGKVILPHPINLNTLGTICLITSDPQSVYSDAISQSTFPESLRKRITRIISISKLKSEYRMFQARRQLKAEHDIFLCDDRVITHLPKTLGKVFYNDGSKRPIPIDIAGKSNSKDESDNQSQSEVSRKRSKDDIGNGLASSTRLAQEITKALNSALIHLAPGVSTAVKVSLASFTAEMCTENIEAVVKGLVERFVPKGWRNVRAVHIKGPNTMAFPIWLADQLWEDEIDVLEYEKKFGKGRSTATKSLEPSVMTNSSSNAETEAFQFTKGGDQLHIDETVENRPKKSAKRKREQESAAILASETSMRQEMRKRQKAKTVAAITDSN